MEPRLIKQRAGCYRTESINGYFGQIVKRTGSWGEKFGCAVYTSAGWHAEVRNSETGDIVRLAGIWDTRESAYSELRSLIDPLK